MDDRVYNEQELKGLLPVSVISEIPVITTPADEEAEQKRLWLGWATAAVVVATILAGSAISYLSRLIFTLMYKSFYNLERNPFELTPDPFFLFPLLDTTKLWQRYTTECEGTKGSLY